MATQAQIDKIKDIIVSTEIEGLREAALFADIKAAVNAAGVTAQNAITLGVNTKNSKKIGDAIIEAVRDYYQATAETTADNILIDEQLTIDEILKYRQGL